MRSPLFCSYFEVILQTSFCFSFRLVSVFMRFEGFSVCLAAQLLAHLEVGDLAKCGYGYSLRAKSKIIATFVTYLLGYFSQYCRIVS